jgi:hypothetical protein
MPLASSGHLKLSTRLSLALSLVYTGIKMLAASEQLNGKQNPQTVLEACVEHVPYKYQKPAAKQSTFERQSQPQHNADGVEGVSTHQRRGAT